MDKIHKASNEYLGLTRLNVMMSGEVNGAAQCWKKKKGVSLWKLFTVCS